MSHGNSRGDSNSNTFFVLAHGEREEKTLQLPCQKVVRSLGAVFIALGHATTQSLDAFKRYLEIHPLQRYAQS